MKWVILDAMGVVYKVGDDTNDLLVPFVKSKNDSLSSERINNLYLQASLGHISSEIFWAKLGFAHEFPEIEHLYLDQCLELDTGLMQFVDSISLQNYQFAMLSNDVSEWSLYLRRKFNLAEYFKHFIISGDVRTRKPMKEIYSFTLSKINTAAENCVFVDDRVKNLKTANELGYRTVFFDRDNVGKEAIKMHTFINGYAGNFQELTDAINEAS